MEEVVLRALEKGVDFIDTAAAYGPSEEIIGRALRRWSGPKPFLATKALPSPQPMGVIGAGWQHPVPCEAAYPRGSIRRSAERSLQALGVEQLDLLQLHQYWADWPDAAWLEEVAELRRAGLVRLVGISVPDHRHEMALPVVRSGLVDSIQTIINIFDPLALDCLVPLARRNGVGIIARCILDEGGLAGTLARDTKFSPADWIHGYFDCVPRDLYLARVDALRKFVPKYAASLAELAIRYVLSWPGVSVALCSMHVMDHLQSNLAALNAGPLPPEVADELRHRHRWIRNFYHERRYL